MCAHPENPPPPVVGVLAIQGSYDLHLEALRRSGAAGRKVRFVEEIEGLAGLIIPGGESTVMAGVALERGLFAALREAGRAGLPMFGTCAGAILLGRGAPLPDRLELVPVEVERNAYGRQRESFEKDIEITPFEAPFHAIFIRAPRLHLPPEHEDLGVEVLARNDADPVLVRHGAILMATFHPELTEDTRIHRYFLEEVVGRRV